jgi:pantothenate kinase
MTQLATGKHAYSHLCIYTLPLKYLFRNISDEAFTYHKHLSPAYSFQTSNPQDMFPYLLVTIGSGVSVLKVSS